MVGMSGLITCSKSAETVSVELDAVEIEFEEGTQVDQTHPSRILCLAIPIHKRSRRRLKP